MVKSKGKIDDFDLPDGPVVGDKDCLSKLYKKYKIKTEEESNVYIGRLGNSAAKRQYIKRSSQNLESRFCKFKKRDAKSESKLDKCAGCQASIEPDEEMKGDKLMLLSTCCFHFMHRQCLIEHAKAHFGEKLG